MSLRPFPILNERGRIRTSRILPRSFFQVPGSKLQEALLYAIGEAPEACTFSMTVTNCVGAGGRGRQVDEGVQTVRT
jgi:hypothetical protein